MIKIFITIILFFISSCQNKKIIDNQTLYQEKYSKSIKYIKKNKYIDSIELLNDIIYNYDNDNIVKNSKLLLAYSYFKNYEFDNSINILDDYLLNNFLITGSDIKITNNDKINNNLLNYALYLKSYNYLNKTSKLFRDNKYYFKAKDYFIMLNKRIDKDNIYKKDVINKINIVYNNIMLNILMISDYHYKKNEYIKSFNILQNFYNDINNDNDFTTEIFKDKKQLLSIISEKIANLKLYLNINEK